MKRHLNLIPPGIQVRQSLWDLCRIWLMFVGMLAVILALATWNQWRLYQTIAQRHARLEESRQMVKETLAEVSSLRQQLETTRQQEAVALSLAEERPVVTVLGLIGQSAQKTGAAVAVAKLTFTSNVLSNAKATASQHEGSLLQLHGIGAGHLPVAQFVAAMRESALFERVDLKSSGEATMSPGTAGRSFIVECAY